MLNKNYNKNHEIKSPINGKAILIEETGDSVLRIRYWEKEWLSCPMTAR